MARVKTGNPDITQGPITKQLLLFFFPILLGTFFQQLYNTVDAVVVGQFVGTQALAAVGGTTGTLINLLVGFFVGLSSGASVIISQFFGARDFKNVSRCLHTAIALSLAGGLVLMVAGLLFAPAGLKLLNTPEDVLPDAQMYMRIYFAGIIATLLYNIGSGILRAMGDSRRPLYILIVCCVVNIVLDLWFVAGLGWGVPGVALATTLSQVVSALFVWAILSRQDEMYRLRVKNIRFHGDLLKQVIRIGFPAGVQSMMYSISNLTIQAGVNSFGTVTMAAWTAYSKIDSLYWMVIGAFGISITTFVGQNFGAGQMDRVHKGIKSCSVMSFAFSFLYSAIVVVFGRFMLGLFTTEADVTALGIDIIQHIAPFYFAYVMIEMLSCSMRGMGNSFVPMIMTCTGICVLRVVWVSVAPMVSGSLMAILISYPVSWAVTSLLFILYYIKGKWREKYIPPTMA